MNGVVVLKFIGVVGFGIFLGFLSAIPIGAVQLDVAKKAINGHLFAALSTAAGSVTSDFIYGFVTLFGLGEILLVKDAQIIIYSLGIAVMCFLFYVSYKEYNHTYKFKEIPLRYSRRGAYFTGLMIALTNPAMILWWIIGFKLLHDMGLYAEISQTFKLVFILSACFGLGSYLSLVAVVLFRMHKNIPERYLNRMLIVLMVLLVVLIVYFIIKIISLFNPGMMPDFLNNVI